MSGRLSDRAFISQLRTGFSKTLAIGKCQPAEQQTRSTPERDPLGTLVSDHSRWARQKVLLVWGGGDSAGERGMCGFQHARAARDRPCVLMRR